MKKTGHEKSRDTVPLRSQEGLPTNKLKMLSLAHLWELLQDCSKLFIVIHALLYTTVRASRLTCYFFLKETVNSKQ